MIADVIPISGTVIQVDCAPAWAKLSAQLKEKQPSKLFSIEIDLGRNHNANKNPIVDNACKEFHKEAIKAKPEGGKLTRTELAIIITTMNRRIRRSGHTSREIFHMRDNEDNTIKPVEDNKSM